MNTTNWRDPIDDYYEFLGDGKMGVDDGGGATPKPKKISYYSFDAKQARDLSDNLDVRTIVEEVLTSIKKAAGKGYKSITIGHRNIVGFEPLHQKIHQELRGLGFQVVMQSDQRDGDYVEVSWK